MRFSLLVFCIFLSQPHRFYRLKLLFVFVRFICKSRNFSYTCNVSRKYEKKKTTWLSKSPTNGTDPCWRLGTCRTYAVTQSRVLKTRFIFEFVPTMALLNIYVYVFFCVDVTTRNSSWKKLKKQLFSQNLKHVNELFGRSIIHENWNVPYWTMVVRFVC